MLLYGDLLVEHELKATEQQSQIAAGTSNGLLQHAYHVWKRDRQLQFQSDVAAILSDAQRTTWDRITSDLRRERVLIELEEQRAIPDLAAVLDELDLDGPVHAQVETARSAYIDDLDPLTRRWEETSLDVYYQMRLSRVSPTSMPEDAEFRRVSFQELWEQINEMIIAAWAITEPHIDEILAALPAEHQRAFLDHTRAVIYPDIYRPSTADMLVERLRHATVDAERLAAIEGIYAEYAIARQANRDRMVDALYRWEHPSDAELRRRSAEQQRLHDEGEDRWLIRRDNPVRQPLHQRRDLARVTCLHIRALFADDEIADLPIGARMALQWAADAAPTRFSRDD